MYQGKMLEGFKLCVHRTNEESGKKEANGFRREWEIEQTNI